jgi:branched-chain amino acid transport system substrate-binding protein
MMQAVLNFLKAKGWTRVVAITSTDASGQDGWNQLQNDVKLPQNQGIEVVDHETFGVEDVSVSAQLTRIATFKPQAIIAWSTGSPIATVFKGLMQSGLQKVPVLTTNGNETYTQMHSYASFLPQQLYFPSPQFAAVDDLAPGPAKTTVQAFFSAFAKQGIKAHIPYAQAWDVGNILINALKHVGLKASPEQIRQYIDNSMEGYVGVLGTYHFSPTDHRGLDVSGIWITRWDQSKDNWVPVSGAGGLGTP